MGRVAAGLGLLLGGCAAQHSIATPHDARPASSTLRYHLVNVMPRFWAYWDSTTALHRESSDTVGLRELFRSMVLRPESVLYAGAGGAGSANVARFVTTVGSDVPAMRVIEQRLAVELPRDLSVVTDSCPDFAWGGTVYIYPSLYNRNGGLFEVNGARVLGFGVDMIARLGGADANIRVLATHELFHLYHFGARPEFGERIGLWGQMWREGLATYASMRLTPNVSESDLLSSRTLREAVEPVLPALLHDVLVHFDDTTRAVAQPYMQSKRVRDDVPPRAGYYIGFRVAQQLGQGRSVAALAHLSPDSTHMLMHAYLERWANGQ